MVEVIITGAFESWQQAARDLVQSGVHPDQVRWVEDPTARVPHGQRETPETAARFVVPRRFVELARAAATHPSAGRWATMYRVLWRLLHENRRLLELPDDSDVRALRALQPSQPVMLDFELELSSPASKDAAGTKSSAPSVIPQADDLGELASAATSCTACELYKRATQVVFGRGPANATLVLVGEQPGDQEDLQGAPFVGPAGEVLDRVLHEIGLDRQNVYITNIVKHFKWEPRGKRRIHQTPRANEIQACRPWLEAELTLVKPRVIVCLGSTAAQALIGSQFRITRSRGQFYRSQWAPWVMGTYHPSAVLRAEDPAGADALYRWLVEDLGHAASRAAQVESVSP
jgi:uracil-DNA glycosylase family protein